MNMKAMLKRYWLLTVYVVFLSFVVGLNFSWVKINTAVPDFDDAGHTVLTLIYSKIIAGEFPVSGVSDFLRQSSYYPPFVYWLATPVVWVFGGDYKVLQYFSVLFVPVSGLFVYLLTKELGKSDWWAFSAGVFYVLFPQVWEQSRYLMLDLPLTTFVLISVYCLVKSDNFDDVRWVLVSFLFASFAQLTKWYAGVFLFVPFVYYFWMALGSVEKVRERVVHAFMGLGVAMLLVLPWYGVNLVSLLEQTVYFSKPHAGNPTSVLSVTNWFYYIAALVNYQVVSITALWLVFSILIWVKSDKDWKWLLVLELVFVYVVFTILGNKNIRFLMPLLPYLAVVMGYGSYWLGQRSKLGSRVLMSGMGLFGAGLFLINSFGFPVTMDYYPVVPVYKVIPFVHFFAVDLSSKSVPYHYRKIDWNPKVVLEDLHKKTGFYDKNILVDIDNPFVSKAIFEMFVLEDYLHFHLDTPPNDDLVSVRSDEEVSEYLKKFDYVIVPKEFVSSGEQFNFVNLDAIRSYILSGNTREFSVISSYQIPNGDELYLLEREPGASVIEVGINGGVLRIKRSQALAMVFMQFQKEDETWFQETMRHGQLEYEISLEGITTVRIDFPPELMRFGGSEEWVWDGDKQFDPVSEEVDR